MVLWMWYTVSWILLIVLYIRTQALSIRTYAWLCLSSSVKQCVLMLLKNSPHGCHHEDTRFFSMRTHTLCILTQGFPTPLIVWAWGHKHKTWGHMLFSICPQGLNRLSSCLKLLVLKPEPCVHMFINMSTQAITLCPHVSKHEHSCLQTYALMLQASVHTVTQIRPHAWTLCPYVWQHELSCKTTYALMFKACVLTLTQIRPHAFRVSPYDHEKSAHAWWTCVLMP